jgi:hypothetical protein
MFHTTRYFPLLMVGKKLTVHEISEGDRFAAIESSSVCDIAHPIIWTTLQSG